MNRDEEGERIWAIVAATVRPLSGRWAPQPLQQPAARAVQPATVARGVKSSAAPMPPKAASRREGLAPPQFIEPGRQRRLSTERERFGGRIDLHGLTQDAARATLTAFVLRGVQEGRRSLLVITGKGALGDGVLRRRVPEWLGEPPLRALVAGLSEAHRRHGGAGALYVALKRRAERR